MARAINDWVSEKSSPAAMQPCLFDGATIRVFRWMSCDGHSTAFQGMLELPVATLLRYHTPPILLDQLQNISILHLRYRTLFHPNLSLSLSDKQSVERRRETRLKSNQPVVVTALGLMGMPPMSGRVLDMSGSGLRLRLANPLPCGSPVKVESEHLVMVGEVSRCEEQRDGYSVGLSLFHVTPTPEKPGRAIMGA
jgi:hypothetical protein